MLNVETKDIIDGIVMKHGNQQSSIITILQEIQERFRYLPEEVLEYLARMDISTSEISVLLHSMRIFH